MSTERLDRLFGAARQAGELLILPHNNPDPDAIASAVALRHLLAEAAGVSSHVGYHGLIGRAENKALMRYLGQPLQPAPELNLPPATPVALIDTHPGMGNISLPAEAGVVIVIDHHRQRDASQAGGVTFVDVRPALGATSTILTGYLQAAGLRPEPPLATALFYGIKTNTMGLGRDTSPADAEAFFYLQPLVDVEAVAEIERAQVPAEYFKSFDRALQTARIFNGVVISYLGPMDYPDLAAEIADLLLRLERSVWVICMGVFEEVLILSIRTRNREGGAGQLIHAVVGADGLHGGHGTMAGGQVPLAGRTPEELAVHLGDRALQYLQAPLGPEGRGRPLI